MGSICAGQNAIKLPNFSKSTMALSHKLDMGTPLYSESAESFFSTYYLHAKSIGFSPTSDTTLCSKISNNKIRAVKIISKQYLPALVISNKQLFTQFEYLKSLKSDLLVKLYNIFETKDSFYIVYEYFMRGSLKNFLENYKFDLESSGKVLKQIINALILLESKGFAVYDLRPENVLIKDKKNLIVKLNGFTARTFLKENTEKSCFSSPEVKIGIESSKSSSWSVGMVALLMMTGTAFEDLSKVPKDVLEKIDPKSRDLISRLLEAREEDRLSLSEALLSDWLA